MLFTTALTLVAIAGSAFAAPSPAKKPPPTTDYFCGTNLGGFRITQAAALAAVTAPALSGFPHEFFGDSGNTENGLGSGGNTQLQFFGGANPICSQAAFEDPDPANPTAPPKRKAVLSEYPVMIDGTAYPGKVGTHSETPARAVWITATGELCGVITHFQEDPKDHHGSGPFRVCDPQ